MVQLIKFPAEFQNGIKYSEVNMCVSIACIILKDDKILIAKRNPVGDMGGRWEFPGGKVENGETDEQSIIREMQEEFGVKVEPKEFITESVFFHNQKENHLHAYKVQIEHDGIEKPYILTEHSEYKWVNPLEIKNLYFVDSDLKIYPEVLKFLGFN